MKSALLLKMIGLLLVFTVPASAARPPVKKVRPTNKSILVDRIMQVVTAGEDPQAIGDRMRRTIGMVLTKDSRIPRNQRPPASYTFHKALVAAMDEAALIKLHRQRSHAYWDQNYTERELKYALDFLTSKVGKRIVTSETHLAEAAEKLIKDSLIAHYQEVTRLPYLEEFPPEPSPSPSAAPSPSPTASASPKAPKPVPSWLTKMIWKLFPDTNLCGCSTE
jgi:hypothetical protein